MAYSKKTWKARQGLGLNKFSIDGATPVAIINQPDSVTQQGDALSAGNLNDLEDRIANAFDDVENGKADKSEINDLQSQINQHEVRLSNLEQVAGDYVTEDMQDYSSVPTGKASYALVETLKGVSRVENQLVKIPSASITTTQNDVTLTDNRDGSYTLNGTASADCTFSYVGAFDALKTTSTYLLVGARTGVTLRVPYGSANDTGSGAIMTVSASAGELRFLVANGTSLNNVTIKPLLTDLTTYFNGGTVPTLAEIQSKYPELLEFRAYTAGEIKNSTYTKVESVGVNIWDEELRNGYYNSSGIFVPDNTYISNANAIRVFPNTEYYFKISGFEVFYYDINGNFISKQGTYSNQSLTTPSNCCYINLHYPKSVEESNRQSQICLNSLADKTTYHPYMTDQLAIPSVTLKGAGSVSDTLDVESGEITRRIGSYTFDGTETVTANAFVLTNYVRIGLAKPSDIGGETQSSVYINTIADKLPLYYARDAWTLDAPHYYIRTDLGALLFLPISVYGSTNESIKTALGTNPITINYSLATPSTDSVSPTLDNTIKTEGGGTVFSDADVDGHFTMGFLNL